MARDHSKSIGLVGFMAAGKSTIGRRLAGKLQLPFVDTDLEIEKSTGRTIAAIFQEQGESEFRRIERETIGRILASRPKVISTGGGAFADPEIRDTLRRRATTIWLDSPFEVVAERLSMSDARPLAARKTSQDLRQLWDLRRTFYAQAEIHIETGEAPAEAVVEQILEAIQ